MEPYDRDMHHGDGWYEARPDGTVRDDDRDLGRDMERQMERIWQDARQGVEDVGRAARGEVQDITGK